MKKVVYKNYFSFVIALVGLLLLFCGLSLDLNVEIFSSNNTTRAEDLVAIQPEGSGAEYDPYLISCPENIKWMHDNNSSNYGLFFKQTANIDLSPYNIYGSIYEVYSYDGGGYELTLSNEQEYFITTISSNGELKNLTVYGGGQDSRIISIVSMCCGVIDNVDSCLTSCQYGFCHTLSTYYYDSWYGKENGIIKNCTNNSTASTDRWHEAGGFVYLLDGGRIENSENCGIGFAAGFAYEAKNKAVLYNCKNSAPIGNAGFVYQVLDTDNEYSCSFYDCINEGDEFSPLYSVGGFTYYVRGHAYFENCHNKGNVDYGFSAFWDVSSQLQGLVYNFYNCTNYTPATTAFVGGYERNDPYGVGFYKCQNYGETIRDGFVGELRAAYVYMRDCINYASSGGAGFVGGLGAGEFYNCVNKGETSVGGGICTSLDMWLLSSNIQDIYEMETIFDGCINYANGVSSGIVDNYTPSNSAYYSDFATILQISNCINYGSASTAGMLGKYGECGDYYGLQISKCENYGVITCGDTYAGGILGSSAGFFSISCCKNFAAVTGGTAGGIVGYVYNGGSSNNLVSSIQSCYVDMYLGTIDSLIAGVKCVDISNTNLFGLVIGKTYGDETLTRQAIVCNFLKANIIAPASSNNYGVIYGDASLGPRTYQLDVEYGFVIAENLAEVNFFTTETGEPTENNNFDFCSDGGWGAYTNILRLNGVEYKVYDKGHLGKGYFDYEFSFGIYQGKTVLRPFLHFASVLQRGVAATQEIVYSNLKFN